MVIQRRAVGLLVLFVCAVVSDSTWAHGGEDHTGASLATSGGAVLGQPISVPKPTQFLLGIETARAKKRSVPTQFSALGHVSIPTAQQADVYSPFNGFLVTGDEFPVPTPGMRVEKGEILAMAEQIFDAPETLSVMTDIAKTESELGQSREELSLARLELERLRKLGDSVSGRRLAEAGSAQAIAEEKVRGLAIALGKMREIVSMGEGNPRLIPIYAPISGVIVASHVTPGEFIESQKLLIEILDNSSVWVEADVYEMDLAIVEDAGRAEIISEAYPAERFEGALNFVGQRIDPDTRTIKSVFTVENPEGRLRDGMFVNVRIETKTVKTGVMFPRAAVTNEGGRDVVYVKIAPETFVARLVTKEGTWGDQVMVTEGVEDGEIVVIQGMYQIRTSASL